MAIPGVETLATIAGGGNVLNTALSAYENEKNRDYNRAMSSTSYRRAAIDLEAAGLNRVLALGSPSSGSAPGMMSYPDFGGTQIKASSAKSVIDLQSDQRKLVQSQTAAADADTAKKDAERRLVEEQILTAPFQRLLTEYQGNTEKVRPPLLHSQTLQGNSAAALNAQLERLQGANASKAVVEKGVYEALAPLVEFVIKYGKDRFSNAGDAVKGDTIFRQGGSDVFKRWLNSVLGL